MRILKIGTFISRFCLAIKVKVSYCMAYLVSNDLVGLVSLVASVLVVFYILGYSLMLFYQLKIKQVRPDWKISAIFYAGILVLAIGYILAITHFCFGTVCSDNLFNGAYLISLILFVYGFELRAGTAQQFVANIKTKRKK